jgi:hypothetical protein
MKYGKNNCTSTHQTKFHYSEKAPTVVRDIKRLLLMLRHPADAPNVCN